MYNPSERKIDKINLIKIKNFYSEENTVEKMKRQTTGCEKYLPKIYVIKDF